MSEITFKELYEKYPKEIMKILLLTLAFQDKTPEKGVVLKHYRYCLVKEQDLEKRPKKEMQSFFESHRKNKTDTIASIYHNMEVMRDIDPCISSRQNLIKTYLTPLVKTGVLMKISLPKKHAYYRINPDHFKEIDIIIRKKYVIDWIKNCSDDDFETLEKESKSMRFDKYTDDYFMKINKAKLT